MPRGDEEVQPASKQGKHTHGECIYVTQAPGLGDRLAEDGLAQPRDAACTWSSKTSPSLYVRNRRQAEGRQTKASSRRDPAHLSARQA